METFLDKFGIWGVRCNFCVKNERNLSFHCPPVQTWSVVWHVLWSFNAPTSLHIGTDKPKLLWHPIYCRRVLLWHSMLSACFIGFQGNFIKAIFCCYCTRRFCASDSNNLMSSCHVRHCPCHNVNVCLLFVCIFISYSINSSWMLKTFYINLYF